MDQIQYTKTYQEYKTELDTELSKTAEGFVRIGYLLKVARDTDVLAQSPYQTVTEFARAEYGIDKTMVSRFISINDRFSEGGYSDQLLEQYKGYGYAKLTLMLSLPDEINQELSPAYSKADIQAIKDEVAAESAITDLEVMMEAGQDQAGGRASGQAADENLLEALVRQLGEDSPELYIQMADIVDLENPEEWPARAKEILAPDGEKQYSIRISGTGRFLVSIRETEDTITVTAIRTLVKTCYSYQGLRDAWEKILPHPPRDRGREKAIREGWEAAYSKEFPGKAGNTEQKSAYRKTSKVQKAPRPQPEQPRQEKEQDAAKAEQHRQETELPAQEPGKPEITGTEPETDIEAAGQPTQEPEETELSPQGPGNSENTGTRVEFRPGIWVRNIAGNPYFPEEPGLVLERHWSVPGWNVRYDGTDMTKIIYDTDIKEFEILEQEPPERREDIPVEPQTQELQTEEQLPDQIGIEEAIEEAAARAAQTAPTDETTIAAGREPGEDLDSLDEEWEKRKNTIYTYVQSMTAKGTALGKRLSLITPDRLRTLRKEFIETAALIEKGLLRRGEPF